MLKKLLIIPAIVLMSQGLFADDHGARPQQPQYQDDQYQDQGGGYGYEGGSSYGFQGGGCGVGCGQFVAPPCGGCGIAVLPPPPPPPIIYNPGVNYYCGGLPCVAPAPPYGPPPVAYIPPPIYRRGPPIYGPPPVVGRPGYGGSGFGGFGPRPMPRGGYVRRMSATGGCAIEQGNNGQFSTISAEGAVLYKSNIPHAEENAEYWKSYYEKNSDQCGGVLSPAKSLDI